MNDKIRWRYGDVNPVVAAVDSASVIEIGDLLYQDVDDAKPASWQTDQGSNPANQELFADKFVGVAMRRSRSGDTDPIRVATTGVFEFDVLAGECFELGDLIGIGTLDGIGQRSMQNQRVTKVQIAKHAIGRVAKREPMAVISVYVDIRSTVMTGGVLIRRKDR